MTSSNLPPILTPAPLNPVPAVPRTFDTFMAEGAAAERDATRAAIGSLQDDQIVAQMRRLGDSDPGTWGKLRDTAAELGLNPDHLAKPEVQRTMREHLLRRELKRRDLSKRFPGTAGLLAGVKWAPMALDDMDNLQTTETKLGALSAAWRRAMIGIDRASYASAAALRRMAGGGAQARDLSDLDPNLAARIKQADERLQHLPESEGFFANATEVVAQQVAMAPKTLGAAGVGFLAGGPVGAGIGAIAAQFAQAGEAEAGNFYADAREAGHTHEEAIGPAMLVFGINGGLEVAGEVFTALPFVKAAGVQREIAKRVAEKLLPKMTRGVAAKKAGAEYLLSGGAEIGTEIVQEIVTAVAENAARDSTPEGLRANFHANTAGDIIDRSISVAVKTAQAMAIVGAPGPSLHLLAQNRRIRAAEEFGQTLAEVATTAAESKVRERDPAAHAEAVQKLAGDAPTLFVEPKQFSQILSQFEAANPGVADQLRNTIPGVLAQVDMAVATGELIEIPVEEYLAKIVNTGLQPLLDPHLRASEGALSITEAAERRKEVEKLVAQTEQGFADAIEQAADEKAKAAATAWKAEVDTVQTAVAAQLRDALSSEIGATLNITKQDIPQLARVQAVLLAAEAKALGMTPAQLHAQKPLKLTAEAEKAGAGEQLDTVGGIRAKSPPKKRLVWKMLDLIVDKRFSDPQALAKHYHDTAFAGVDRTPEQQLEAWNLVPPDEKVRHILENMVTDAEKADLFDSTGWQLGKDGLPRFEIDDSKAKVSMEFVDTVRELIADVRAGVSKPEDHLFVLGDVLKHDKLYKQYPWAAKLKFKFINAPPGTSGAFLPNEWMIVADANLTKAIGYGGTAGGGRLRSLLLHELQHALQTFEGFALGFDLRNGLDFYRAVAGEVEARNVEARADLSAAMRKRVPLERTEDVPRADQHILTSNPQSPPALAWEFPAEAQDEPNLLEQLQSTAIPTGKKPVADPRLELLLQDFASMKNDPKAFKQAMDAVRQLPILQHQAGATDEQVAEALIQHVADNLTWLYEQMSPQDRERSRLWYDGGRKFVERWADRYGLSPMQAAAVIAVLSPQKDWFVNMTMAERMLDIVTAAQNHVWDERMTKLANRRLRAIPRPGKWKAREIDALVRGKTLAQVMAATADREVHAYWVRIFDQAHNDSQLARLTPEGGAAGKASQRIQWAPYATMAKVLSLMQDGSAANVSLQLGAEAKVRNFYNNLFAPNAREGFVTIDTHAVAAAYLLPLASGHTYVAQVWGGAGGAPTPANAGVKGLYPLIAEAHRRAGEKFGLLPREMQSITWEQVRAMFTPAQKRDEKLTAQTHEVWARHSRGEITADAARTEVHALFGGRFEPMFWEGIPSDQPAARTYTGLSAELVDALPVPGRKQDPTRIMVEVKPNLNPELLAAWERLTPEQQAAATERVLREVVPLVLETNHTSGEIVMQRGAREGAPSSSAALFIDNPDRAVAVADALGRALHQEGMFVMSLQPGQGLRAGRAVSIELPEGFSVEDIDRLYVDKLWPIVSATGQRAVVGHSTHGRHMVIGVDPEAVGMTADELLQAMQPLLDDRFAARVVDLHIAFRSAKDDYAHENPAAEPAPAGSLAPTRADDRVGAAAAKAYRRAFEEADRAGPNRLAAQQLGAYDLSTAEIFLRPGATPATVLHEMMHHYVDTLLSISEPSAEAQSQIDTLLKFWGVTREQWDAMGFKERQPLHEAVTYNWERYLATGEAPAPALRTLFGKILLWMRRAYESLRDLGSTRDIEQTYESEFGKPLPDLTPELRQFFDLIFASEEQAALANAVREQAVGHMTREQALSLGVEPADWERYQLLREAAAATMVGDLTAEQMKRARWLREAVLKSEADLGKEVGRRRAVLRKKVDAEVRARLVYRTIELLRHGTIDTGEGPVPAKIDPDSMTDLRFYRQAEKNETFKGMTRKGGWPIDLVAVQAGYPNGDAMLQDILEAEPLDTVVDRETEARLRQEEALADPVVFREMVARAVHGELRGRMLAAEVDMLAGVDRPARLSRAAAREAASRLLARTRVADLSPRRVLELEGRAVRASRTAIVEGRLADALLAARQQLVYHELAKLAIDARENVGRLLRSFAPMRKGADLEVAKRRSMPWVWAARTALAAWGIGDPVAPNEALAHLREHAPAAARDVDRELTPVLTAVPKAAGKGPAWQSATVEAFQQFGDTVKLFWHRAEREASIGSGQDRLLVEAAASELVDQLAKTYGQPGKVVPLKPKERRGLLYRFAGAALRRTEHWIRQVDGGADGPAHRYLWRPLRRAYDDYLAAFEGPLRTLQHLLKELEPTLSKTAIAAPEIGHTFTNGRELVGALQHIGNASNREALLENYGWATRDPVTGELDTTRWDEFLAAAMKDGRVKKVHLDYVQAVWDFNRDVLAPQSQKTMLDLFGVFWKPIEPEGFDTPWGRYDGGYTPRRPDPQHSANASLRADLTLDALREMETNLRASMPGSKPAGHTISRVSRSTRPLSLDLGVQLQHIDEVLRFVHLQPALRDVASVLKNPRFSTYLNAVDQTVIREMLLPMLEATARNQITTPPAGTNGFAKLVDRLAGQLRRNIGLGIMFGSVRNALQQAAGVSNANNYVAAKHLGPATAYTAANPLRAVREAVDRSQFMRLRIDNRLGDLRTDIEVILDPEKFGPVTRFANRFGYVLQSLVQHRVDVATWHGAFAESLETQHATAADEAAVAKAVEHADEAVRLSQGSQTPIDVAGYERGGALWRLIVQFSSYPNLVLNQIVSQKGYGPRTAAILRALVVPSLISAAVIALLSPPPDDDDDDGSLAWEYLRQFGADQVKGATSLVPIIGPAAGSLLTRVDRRAVDRITPAPGWSVVDSVARLYGAAERATTGEPTDLTGTLVKDFGMVLTTVTGVPITPATRTVGYLIDAGRGKADASGVWPTLRGVVTGR